MSAFINNVLALIVTLGLLIAFHEFGHFWTARRLGVKVLRFSIGFGKPLWTIRRGPDQTEYVVAAFPLGGYVKMLDEREGEVQEEEKHRAFNRQPVWSRFAIVSAGPLFNFFFAILAFWLMYLVGVPGIKPVIGEVTPNSAAAVAGFETGDEIITVNGEETPTWGSTRLTLLDKALDHDEITLQVRGKEGDMQSLTLSVADVSTEIKQKDLLGYLGIQPVRPGLPPILGDINPGSPAEKSGLRSGDRVLKVNDQAFSTWVEMAKYIHQKPGQEIRLEIEREGQVEIVHVTPEEHKTESGVIGLMGVRPAPAGPPPPELATEVQYSLFKALGVASVKTWDLSMLTLRMIGKMIIGEVSVKNLSGPITIATYAGYSASIGLTSFLYFLAIVSISLGVLNLLPVPLLDGGHLMYYLVEMVKGKPLSDEIQSYMQRFGIAILATLMILALYNDISRLFSN